MITRSVRGTPDEAPNNDGFAYIDEGYYPYLHDVAGNLNWQRFANGEADGEPDLYFYNFNGFSGKFYFRPDGRMVEVDPQDLK